MKSLLLLSAILAQGDFEWKFTDKNFDWRFSEVEGPTARDVDKTTYQHKLKIGDGVVGCVHIGNGFYVTAGHVFWERAGQNCWIDDDPTPISYELSTSDDFAIIHAATKRDAPAVAWVSTPLRVGQRLTICARLTGVVSGTVASFTTDGAAKIALDSGATDTQSGDSGSGVYDENGDLVAVHVAHVNGEHATRCVPLSEVKGLLSKPLRKKPRGAKKATRYVTAWCPNCCTEQVSAMLEREGYEVTDVNVDSDNNGTFETNPDSINSVPAFNVDGRVYEGANVEQARSALLTPIVSAQEAAQSQTPPEAISRVLEAIELKPDQVLVDLGCGDARAPIIAVEQFNARRAVGVEIDPARSAVARERVAQQGLRGRVAIIDGDATKVDVEGDVAFVYLYPQTLQQLLPKLQQYDTVVSYMHPVEGLNKSHRTVDKFHVYETARAAQGRPYAIYGNMKFYGPCCNDGSCMMRQNIMWQLSTRQHVE